MIPLRHIPSLFLATSFTIGGFWPLWSAEACKSAMNAFGLPSHVTASQPAQSVMMVYSSRMTVIGLAMYTFYYRRMYGAIDVLLLCLGWAGVVDGYVCWKEGAEGHGVFRFVSAMVVAGLGMLGVTAGG